jgi:hypothetical protein
MTKSRKAGTEDRRELTEGKSRHGGTKTDDDPFLRDVGAGVKTMPAEALAKAGQLTHCPC